MRGVAFVIRHSCFVIQAQPQYTLIDVDDDARKYWTEQMDAAYLFMERLLEYPVAECGQPLACLRNRARQADVEIAFAPGKKLGMFERIFHFRTSLLDPLLAAGQAFLRRGYVLKIEDGYRSPDVQKRGARSEYAVRSVFEKVRWELDGGVPSAELLFRRLCVWTATTPKFANHTSGSALDVSILHRRDGSMVDLGGKYPEPSARTPMASPLISAAARRHRDLICEVFAEHGFLPYPYEFWHFSHGDADYEMLAGNGRPARFGPVQWCPETRQLTPIEDMLTPLITLDDIRPELAKLLRE